MKNRIPYILLSVLLLSKVFAWWLLFFGIDYSNGTGNSIDNFALIHQISYLTLSSFFVVGILLKSKLSIAAMFVTFLINATIFLFRDTAVYQSVFDPLLLLLFCFVIHYQRPNSWCGSSVK
jgi:hypothetical protein